ncbi:MAG: hypothetical protein J6X42_02305, partial [Alphaproteobacteria bacterium]|nr:hypothetical protein [Alphaproteobacteria bacterium]
LREIRSWEAKLKRDADKHRKKTDFEKFQEMFEKIEFSKLTSYGVTLPNPFVGNAGVGVWVEDEDGYRARLISELARTGQAEEVLTALHIVVPNHRLMLGIPKDDGQNAPVIALDHMQNIKSYEVLYPMPWQTSGENAVGVYAGDFAFIIKLKLENPSQPTYFEAALGFDDCDFELNCAAKKMNLSLDIQNDETGDDVKSSMLQFIRQSYYNMPKAHNKYVALKKASYDAATHQLNFEFSYDTSVKNWLFLLDNGHHSTFGVPKIILANHQIFVQVNVENGFENFEKTPLTYYLRLNSFAFLKQTIGLEKTWVESTSALPFKILLSAFCVGILFCLMPFGFYTLAAAMSDVGYSWKRKLMRTISKTVVLTAFIGFVFYALKHNPDLFYINLTHNLCYLGIVLSCMIFYFWRRDWPISKGKAGDVICGVTRGLWCVLMLCLVITPYQQTLMLSLTDTSDILKVYAGFGLVGGLLVPDMLAFWRKKAFSDKGRKGWIVSSDMMLGLAIAVVIFYISAQLGLTGSMKAVFWGLLAFSVLKYLMNFLSALYRTDLSIIQIRSATGVVLVLMALTVNVFAHKLQKLAPVPTETLISLEKIKSAIENGQNVVVAVNDEACLSCVYNRLTALNASNIRRLGKIYPLEYIKTDATNTTPEMIAFFKEFKHLRAPLYVFYNALVPNGIVLPDLLSETEIARTLQRFAI